MQTQTQYEGGKPVYRYDGLVLSWSKPEGLTIILEVLGRLVSPATPPAH